MTTEIHHADTWEVAQTIAAPVNGDASAGSSAKTDFVVEVPSLGRFLRQVRERQRHPVTGNKLSRELAARRIGLSGAYLVQIENGSRVPAMQALRLLASGYDLSDAQCRYVRELREPSEPLVDHSGSQSGMGLRGLVRERLEEWDRAGVIAGYFDPLWSVVAGNSELFSAFPELDRIGNLALWHFSDIAQAVLCDWEHEARQMVAMLKPALGRHRGAHASRNLLAQLAGNEDFCMIWTEYSEIAYAREPGDLIRFNGAGGRYSVNLEVSAVAAGRHCMHLYQGFRRT
ncbi:helix-turn-helix domain-containing protein [Nocardia carnea]|uniref:helix-turn-helix domain-containing protein n=1 Tax=Nocardia carnea TaxID=37328 RepID=UPI002455FDED|nr:helix-turn-helix domain-containing protein [Nocardia carnea]